MGAALPSGPQATPFSFAGRLPEFCPIGCKHEGWIQHGAPDTFTAVILVKFLIQKIYLGGEINIIMVEQGGLGHLPDGVGIIFLLIGGV